jgi:hypothetical protein
MKKKLLLFISSCVILSGICFYSQKGNFYESKLEKELKRQEILTKELEKDSLYYNSKNYNYQIIHYHSKRDGTYCFNYFTNLSINHNP